MESNVLPRFSVRTRIAWMTALGVVLVVAPPAPAQFGPARVVTARAEMRQMPATLTLVGTVEPRRRSTLGAGAAGKVVEMPARQGDLVEEGALVCHLDDAVLQHEYAREQAVLAARRARLEELENGTRKETLARVKADLDAMEALANRWAFELQRVMRLHGDDYANEREYQDTLSEQRSADARRDAAQAIYDEAVAGPRAEVLAQARFDVAEQEAEVERIATEISRTMIRAPYKGFVSRRDVEVGTWVKIGDPVIELVELDSVLVRVDVPESAITYARVGEAATVRIDALGQTFTGSIRHAIPQAHLAARTFPVEIELANPDHLIKGGMFARATVPAGPVAEQLAVPKDALIDAHGSLQVALIVPGEKGPMATPVFVTTGADGGDWVAITSGNIPPGAEVAVYGNEQLVYPQPVTVVQTPAEVDNAPSPDASAEKTPAKHG